MTVRESVVVDHKPFGAHSGIVSELQLIQASAERKGASFAK